MVNLRSSEHIELFGSVSLFWQEPVVVKTVRLTSVLLDVLNIQDVTQPRKDCL